MWLYGRRARIFYLPAMLVLVSNLITTRQRVNILLWVAMLAILFVGIYGTIDYFTNLKDASINVDWLIEHATRVRMNSLFVFVIAVWMYKASPNKRYILPTDAAVCDFDLPFRGTKSSIPDPGNCIRLYGDPPVQRKQAPLLDDHPSCCPSIRWRIWLYSGTARICLILPANAVKSMIFSNQASYEDQLSNIYRMIENVNASFTIHAAPLTGVGFGNKFYIIIPMPDISFFVWWEYITHNSIIWIWMKSGVGGFLAMLFLIGMAVMTGVRALLRMPKGDLSASSINCATIYHYAFHVCLRRHVLGYSKHGLCGDNDGTVKMCLKRSFPSLSRLPQNAGPGCPSHNRSLVLDH